MLLGERGQGGGGDAVEGLLVGSLVVSAGGVFGEDYQYVGVLAVVYYWTTVKSA